jgi:hypothetical protein
LAVYCLEEKLVVIQTFDSPHQSASADAENRHLGEAAKRWQQYNKTPETYFFWYPKN